MTKADIQRFWSKVNKTEGCWLWAGAACGYGRFTYKGKPIPAHRFSVLASGRCIPKGMVVCHTCDTKLCVRPDHLYVGTTQDNNRDTVDRQRHISSFKPKLGESNGNSRLTEHQVREIRRMRKGGLSLQRIANHVGCSRGVVRSIVERTTWKHVD